MIMAMIILILAIVSIECEVRSLCKTTKHQEHEYLKLIGRVERQISDLQSDLIGVDYGVLKELIDECRREDGTQRQDLSSLTLSLVTNVFKSAPPLDASVRTLKKDFDIDA